jgi:putative two-component system response regulator
MNAPERHKRAALYEDVLPYAGAPDIESRLERLEQRLRADESALFGPAETAILALDGKPANRAHVLCLLLLARRHQYNLDFESAFTCSSAAVGLARTIDDPAARAKALKFLGLVLSEASYVAESIPIQMEAIEHARKAQDTLQISETLNNLGISLLYAARYGAAQECFAQALAALPTSSATWINKAELLLEIGEIGLALKVAQHGLALIIDLQPREWKELRVYVEVVLTQLRVAIGDIQQAAEHSKIAVSEARYAGEFATRFARLASLLVAAHDPSISSDAISSLLNEVRKNESHFSLYRNSLNVAVAALQAADRPEEALTFLRKVTELRMIQRARVANQPLPSGIMEGSFPDLDYLAEVRARGYFDVLQVQAARSVTASDQQIESLVELAIRAELREEDTFSHGEHVYRVARLSELLAREAECSDEGIANARFAGLLHDVGKVFAPDQLLLKRDALTDHEKALLRKHSDDGAGLIENLKNNALLVVADAVRRSHERWDGGGYPAGLQGETIPIAARIVAICDSFDAMTHWRPFRSPRSFASALSEIEAGSGSRYDPRLSRLFVNLLRRLQRETDDLDRFLAEGAENSPVVQEQRRLAKLLRPQRETL